MKKYLILFILFTHISTLSADVTDDKVSVRVLADFYSCPLLYEYSYYMFGGSFNGSVTAGARFRKFTFGGELDINYFSLTGRDSVGTVSGAGSILRGSFVFYARLHKLVELKAGIGGAWLSTAMRYTYKGTLQEYSGAPSILLDTIIYPWKYLSISQINRLDLFINADRELMPYYYGGVRVSFNPFLNWIDLFLDVGVMTLFYDDLDISLKSVSFVWNLGMAVDLSFPETPRYMRQLVEDFKKKRDPETIIVYKDRQFTNTIDRIADAEIGDVFSFTSIVFFPDSAEIKEESYPVLDTIAAALKERSDIVVEIGGYTNSVGNPDAEMELSIQRAMKVVQYFKSKGISMYRMKAAGYGGLASRNKKIDESNRRVEIKVIDIIESNEE